MGSGEALKAAKVYRELMKAVKKHVGKEEHKTHFTDFIKSEFRKAGDGLETSFVQQKINLARDYTYLLNSVHHHQVRVFHINYMYFGSSVVCIDLKHACFRIVIPFLLIFRCRIGLYFRL